MVFGNGLIANAFANYRDDDSILILASGVSNSTETNERAYIREVDLVKSALDAKLTRRIVYFSTCSIYDPSLANSRYIDHKKKVEALIQAESANFLIVRLSNIVGHKGNEHNLVNYFVSCVRNKYPINLWKNSTRNILDIDDGVFVVNTLIRQGLKNVVVNVANPESYKVTDILAEIELFLDTEAMVELVDMGAGYHIDISYVLPIVNSIGRDFSLKYMRSILEKYYRSK